MKRLLVSIVVAMAGIGLVSAQLRSFNSGISGREEKAGSGQIQADNGNIKLRRIFLRFDNNSDVFVRMYPEAQARTYSGRYNWEGNNRIRITLTQGTGHMTGYVQMNRSGNSLTFGTISFDGETSGGASQSVRFNPDRPNSPGSSQDTPVADWNNRWGNGNGSGGAWGGGNGGGWGDNSSFNGSSSGIGNVYYDNRTYNLRRADFRLNGGDARLKLNYGSGDIEVSGDNAQRRGNTITFNVDKFKGKSGSGQVTIVVQGSEINSVSLSGRANGRNFNGDFRR